MRHKHCVRQPSSRPVITVQEPTYELRLKRLSIRKKTTHLNDSTERATTSKQSDLNLENQADAHLLSALAARKIAVDITIYATTP